MERPGLPCAVRAWQTGPSDSIRIPHAYSGHGGSAIFSDRTWASRTNKQFLAPASSKIPVRPDRPAWLLPVTTKADSNQDIPVSDPIGGDFVFGNVSGPRTDKRSFPRHRRRCEMPKGGEECWLFCYESRRELKAVKRKPKNRECASAIASPSRLF